MSEFLGFGESSIEAKLTEAQSAVPEDLAHPVRILMDEHKDLIKHVEMARSMAISWKTAKCSSYDEISGDIEKMRQIAEHFKESENHYQREENALFPYLEKHGITGPPAAMWAEHEIIRETKKNYHALFEDIGVRDLGGFLDEVAELSDYLRTTLFNHFYKENNVLFQMALQTITDDEWVEIRDEFDELGYCCFTPPPFGLKAKLGKEVAAPAPEAGAINFETGYFLPNEVEALLNTIPLEITFIDANDEVRYFNRSRERLFVRTKASLGRKVHQCHPKKSLHLVNQIVEDFKSGQRDEADFWIELEGRFIYIRFFPVRDADGNYLGAMEVVQDVTGIRKLEGEKRLL